MGEIQSFTSFVYFLLLFVNLHLLLVMIILHFTAFHKHSLHINNIVIHLVLLCPLWLY